MVISVYVILVQFLMESFIHILNLNYELTIENLIQKM